jgi:hypothetical protein
LKNKVPLCLLFALLLSAFALPASGNIIPNFTGESCSVFCDYSYTTSLSGVSELDISKNAAYFTILDVYGFDHATAPAGWSITTCLACGVAPGTSPPDSPSVINVQFSYISSLVWVAPQNFAGFHLFSTQSLQSASVNFTGLDTNTTTLLAQSNMGLTVGPAGPNVPEPGTMVMFLGAGILLALGSGRRFKKEKQGGQG